MQLRQIVLLTALATLSACRIEVLAPVEGSVTTTSGVVDCAAGQTCTLDVADVFFDETFEAVPAPGWIFAGWQAGQLHICDNSLAPCNYSTALLAGNPNASAFLDNQNLVLNVEPVFAVDRRTDLIDLAGEQTIAQFGLELDFYRNSAYECGLSGNYTFMVFNPINGDADDEAPLWVYLHGGGAGHFDSDGSYYGQHGQTAQTWNSEETLQNLLDTMSDHMLDGGAVQDITLTRRLQEGYRMLAVSMCDHDMYSGLGTPYPHNPSPNAEVNGMQATMSAVEYVVANYPTTQVWAHGDSAGSTGAHNLVMSFAAENIHLTGALADSVVLSSSLIPLTDAYSGAPGSNNVPGFDPDALTEKLGFYGDIENNAHSDARINAGFDDVPILFVGGKLDPTCYESFPAIPEAQALGLSSNCEYYYEGLKQAIDGQPDSPHQLTFLADAGHTPTNEEGPVNDTVDAFIGNVLVDSPPSPFQHIPGYNTMMMGHSFFMPMADQMPFHAVRSGVADHTQSVEFSGGASGAPLALWNNPGHRASVQAVLDTGTIELFGMTYEPTYPTTEGYELWIDYALSQNPDTKFFIALPWADFPSNYADAAAYANFWQPLHDGSWHDLIDELRVLYPGVEIFCIPYGQAALELRTLLEAGNLPDLTVLTGTAGDGLFSDNKGHSHEGEILYDTAELVWLNAIYAVELDEYAYDPGYITDIKAIAKSIMDGHDPAYNKQ